MLTLDANVLVYTVDARDPVKHVAAITILARAAQMPSLLGLQAIGEFYAAATRKVRLKPNDIRDRIPELLGAFRVFSHTPKAFAQAAGLAAAGRYFYWDAVLLASAEEAGCTLMLSEDMADGARLGSLVVRNPFGPDGLSAAARDAIGR